MRDTKANDHISYGILTYYNNASGPRVLQLPVPRPPPLLPAAISSLKRPHRKARTLQLALPCCHRTEQLMGKLLPTHTKTWTPSRVSCTMLTALTNPWTISRVTCARCSKNRTFARRTCGRHTNIISMPNIYQPRVRNRRRGGSSASPKWR